ncbi:MAG: hypothetical protein WCF23_00290 [Candidatus Nitrosopolaris sp.]
MYLRNPIRKAHLVGSSAVLTLDPTHVRRLQIDDSTFFVEKPVEDGILLQICRLDFGSKKEEEASRKVEGPSPDVKYQSSTGLTRND